MQRGSNLQRNSRQICLEYAQDGFKAAGKEKGKEVAELKKSIAEVKKKIEAQAI